MKKFESGLSQAELEVYLDDIRDISEIEDRDLALEKVDILITQIWQDFDKVSKLNSMAEEDRIFVSKLIKTVRKELSDLKKKISSGEKISFDEIQSLNDRANDVLMVCPESMRKFSYDELVKLHNQYKDLIKKISARP